MKDVVRRNNTIFFEVEKLHDRLDEEMNALKELSVGQLITLTAQLQEIYENSDKSEGLFCSYINGWQPV